MRSLIYFWIILLSVKFMKSIQLNSDHAIADKHFQNSCMVGENNFNRSCIYHKLSYLLQKLPYISSLSIFQAGPLQFIKLPNNPSSVIPATDEKPKSRSLSTNIISFISKNIGYFFESYGIKVRLPSLSKNLPGIVEEYSDVTQDLSEGRGKKKDKKYALVFPLIATFKFILIKALLIPILMGILAIKKMMVMAAMAIPTIIAMVRICRFGPGFGGGGGGLFTGATGGFTAPVVSAPVNLPQSFVASDTLIGDFSNYAPMSQQNPYYSKQQDFGGKGYI